MGLYPCRSIRLRLSKLRLNNNGIRCRDKKISAFIFLFFNKILYFIQDIYFCILMSVLSFFFTCEAKKKESTKEKRKHAVNLRLRYAQSFSLVRLRRIYLASQTRAKQQACKNNSKTNTFTPQTVLGYNPIPSLLK